MLECRGKFWHLPYLLEMIITAGRYSFKNLASTLALPLHKFTEEQAVWKIRQTYNRNQVSIVFRSG